MKMNKYPDSITIAGGVVYKIKYTAEPIPVEGAEEVLYGEVDLSNQVISIWKGERDENSVAITLLHEILHALSQVFQQELTEKQVSVLAVGLVDVIQRNDLDLRPLGYTHGDVVY